MTSSTAVPPRLKPYTLQGYLAHKKQRPPRNLLEDHV